METVPN